MDLDSVADELYGLPPGEFTPARNAASRQARAEGDRALATSIQQLRRPTASAWLVNRLARELAAELEPLMLLGQELREASSHLTGDELRALTRQRQQLVHALVRQAARVGAADGHRVSEVVLGEVRQTLEASLADPDVAAAVRAGRLSRAAEHAGFGVPGGAGPGGPPVDRPSSSAGGAAQVTDLADHRRESAERSLAETAGAMTRAWTQRDAASQGKEQAEHELQAARREVDAQRAALERAEQEVERADRADRAAAAQLDRAETELHAAQRNHVEAQAHLADLTDRRP